MRARAACAALIVAAVACSIQPAARAHTRSVSYSSWELDGERARVVLRLSQLELTRLPWGATFGGRLHPALGTYLTDRLQLLSSDAPCAVVAGPVLLASAPERAAVEWEIDCGGIAGAGASLSIRSGLLVEAAPSHLHFARVRTEAGAHLERMLNEAEPTWRLGEEQPDADAEPVGSSFGAYVWLGIEHILTGYDHLAFVFGLVLLAVRLGEVATVVTGFTIAHSITLALAVLGFVEPEMRAIEALIGLSIALVAAENTWRCAGRPRSLLAVIGALLVLPALLSTLEPAGLGLLTSAGMALFCVSYLGLLHRLDRSARLRIVIAFAFGLVHGFGFAGVLAEIELPTERLAAALFGFNVGVELGQLACVGLLWPLLRALHRLRAGAHRWLVETASAAVCGLGLFWFVTRAFG